MAYDGYFLANGQEIINSTRTAAYARDLAQVSADQLVPWLDVVLQGTPYASPMVDEAPWYDPDDAASWRFFGLVPISVTGVEDGSNVTTFANLALGGATPTDRRRQPKEIVVTAMMVGQDDEAISTGYQWLRQALDPPCDDCGGYDLCFFSSAPDIDPLADDPDMQCIEPFRRIFRRVAVTVPLQETGQLDVRDDLSFRIVTWTWTVGTPFMFSPERLVSSAIMGAVGPDLIVFDRAVVDQPCGDSDASVVDAQATYQRTVSTLTALLQVAQASPTPANKALAASATTAMETARAALIQATLNADILRDPLSPPQPAPPQPPLPLATFSIPTVWDRRALRVADSFTPALEEMVPVIWVRTGDDAVRFLRFQMQADPVGLFAPEGMDPCGACGELIVTYMPAHSELILDASSMSARITVPGGSTLDASSNITSTLANAWPSIACGLPYVFFVDTPGGGAQPAEVSLSLMGRS